MSCDENYNGFKFQSLVNIADKLDPSNLSLLQMFYINFHLFNLNLCVVIKVITVQVQNCTVRKQLILEQFWIMVFHKISTTL